MNDQSELTNYIVVNEILSEPIYDIVRNCYKVKFSYILNNTIHEDEEEFYTFEDALKFTKGDIV